MRREKALKGEGRGRAVYCLSHNKPFMTLIIYQGIEVLNDSYLQLLVSILLEYSSLGCWREDLSSTDRAIPDLQTDEYQHHSQSPTRLHNIISECAQRAKAYGYSFFGIRDHHHCVSDPHAGLTYSKYGPSSLCRNGTGGPGAMNVYSFDGKFTLRF